MSVLSSPVPPAAQTTAAEPGVTEEPKVNPQRPELTTDWTDRADPRPATLATQEVRLALAFTGGVSLAVWMGGVARELDLLVQASDRRRVLRKEDKQRKQPSPATVADPHRLRGCYRQLLDLVDAQITIDVLAGTSAGGINAALLGLVNARSLDLGALRDIWLKAGDVGRLLRDPREKAPPSLLSGDNQMLTALNDGIEKIVGEQKPPAAPRKTDVYITTTLLSPEVSRYTDDYGTQIGDADHHAMFHFDQDALAERSIAAPLALAARSSASFPGAFEPSFLPYGRSAGKLHPDMKPHLDATCSHWAADGGLLVNRPVAPVLQSIFDREADRQVRRALLYVVPSSAPAAAPPVDEQSKPLGLAAALRRDLAATMNQSIASDLAAIREHNDRVRATADTRLRLATLGSRLPGKALIADANTWADYRKRQGEWLVAPLITELSRQLSTLSPTPENWKILPGTGRDAEMRAAALATATEKWPTSPPADEAEALQAATYLGRPAFDAAKATLLRILRLGQLLSTNVEERYELSRHAMRVLRPLSGSRRGLGPFVREHLAKADPKLGLPDLAARLAADLVGRQGSEADLGAAWTQLRSVVAEAVPPLRALAAATPKIAAGETDEVRASLARRRAMAAEELLCYLRLLTRRDTVSVLLDLHVAVRSVQPVLQEVEQIVELIQVSADTRSLLAPRHPTAASKLTGLQFHHFGAFYKRSWRANDWMWGRLDGCGWLVHMLLDPRRILAVLENDDVDVKTRVTAFVDRLERAFSQKVPSQARKELAYLNDETTRMPVSLPKLSTWLAGVFQHHIAAEELPTLAEELRVDSTEGRRIGPAAEQRTWLRNFDAWKHAGETPEGLAVLLDGCPVASETLEEEARSRTPLFLRTVTRAAAVATAAGTGIKDPPRSLRPTFSTARAVTLTAYAAAERTSGKRGIMVAAGLGLLAGGALAMLTHITVLGFSGLLAFITGAFVLAISIGRGVVVAVGTLAALAVVLLSAAPWLPWLGDWFFPKLSGTVPWMRDHSWTWPVVLFLILLPPLTLLVDVARATSRQRR